MSVTSANAFIGAGSPTISRETGKESYYFSIINEAISKDEDGNVTSSAYKGPGNENDLAPDEIAETYDGFSWPGSGYCP